MVLLVAWMFSELRNSRAQRRAVQSVRQLGGWASYDYQVHSQGNFQNAQHPRPEWLRRIAGDDFTIDVVSMGLPRDGQNDGFTDEEARDIQGMTALVSLELPNTSLTDAGVAYFTDLTSLRFLNIRHARVSDQGLASLNQLRQLEFLDLNGNLITDNGLQHLSRMSRLVSLNLGGTQVTHIGLKHIAWLEESSYSHPIRN